MATTKVVDKVHKHWLSLKTIANSTLVWIRDDCLMARYAGANEDGLSAKVATIRLIDSDFVYIKCRDSHWAWLQENV